MTARIRSLVDAAERRAAIPELAALRIAVFREWPYLYDGSPDYEAEYLREFAQALDSVLVIAEQDGKIIGAATASPMASQKAEIQNGPRAYGLDIQQLFYFGESVLLPAYRGAGIGHAFFDAREAAARAARATTAAFCAVIRPDDHPLRPAGARDLAPFWAARGYAPVTGLTCQLAWQDIDQSAESSHAMQYWSRAL